MKTNYSLFLKKYLLSYSQSLPKLPHRLCARRLLYKDRVNIAQLGSRRKENEDIVSISLLLQRLHRHVCANL